MCGIAGWISWDRDLPTNTEIMDKMLKTLENRGPDAYGTYLHENALLGHRRLSIVDLEKGAQPMTRNKGSIKYTIIYNGELYNTCELRNELEAFGYSFSTHCDTEVLLVSYIHWGKECVKKLNGIFAFGVWDEENQTLFLARDRFGVKPLFYSLQYNNLIFSSEIKALLKHPFVSSIINEEGLAEIFALAPSRTPGFGVFKDIKELKPGYCGIYDRNGFETERYWQLESHEHEDDFDTTVVKVRELIIDSIERQLVSDVPVCTFLSGGVDSSTITSIAADNFIRNGLDTLNTYSVDYDDNNLYFKPNEFQPNSDDYWIQKVSKYSNTVHHNIIFDSEQLASSLESAMKARDLPGMADIDSSLYLFCAEIKKNYKVALSGECADEVFGGYPWFHNTNLLNLNSFPWLRYLDDRLSFYSPELVKWSKPVEYVSQRYIDTLYEVPLLKGESEIEAKRRQMFYLNFSWFMATLLDRKDRMSMSYSLEVRVPFCDHRIVEYVWNIPWEMKNCDGREKGIMRRALKGILPQDVLERKKSPYPKTFHPKYAELVSSKLSDILEDKTSPLLALINVPKVKEMASSKGDLFAKPWFGQLMTGPQFIAYLIQVNTWLKEYNVNINI